MIEEIEKRKEEERIVNSNTVKISKDQEKKTEQTAFCWRRAAVGVRRKISGKEMKQLKL